jgi:hypothetical protein
MSETPKEGMSQLDRTFPDAGLRAAIFRYSMEQASPVIRPHIQHLAERWVEYNAAYFSNELTEPFLAFEEPGHTGQDESFDATGHNAGTNISLQ